jgi:dTDP-glucose pyrophosphorylase
MVIMIIIIPLGGIGQRFKNNNYVLPKSLIKIFGKSILHYLLDSLHLETIDFVYIPYNKEYIQYNFEENLKKNYPNIHFKFCKLIDNTRGAAETLNIAIKKLSCEDCPVLCLDGDNFYLDNIIKKWNGNNCVITFNDNESKPIYSYVKLENNKIIDIIEKEKISNNACSGAYGFKSFKQLLKITQYIIDNNITIKDEFYTSLVIKELLKQGLEFNNIEIKKEDWICLGTPLQLRHFYHNYPKVSYNSINKIQSKRYCFDLDNTLINYLGNPIKKNIKFLKYIKSFGHKIIIYTERDINNLGKITFELLDKFKIPYDEIYFNKPKADIYIDDLGLNCYQDMEKYLGFYMDNIDTRSFNSLQNNIIETYTKKGKTDFLDGEIYYYNNIPREIKDLFALFIDYGNDWYKMEKINGITVSTLYLSELLTIDNLKHIMNSIKRIQSVKVPSIKVPSIKVQNINIYDNYLPKLIKRYQDYNYERFRDSEKIYNELYEQLDKYEKNNLGRISVIHGDTVMTNIIINNFDKIKFIDMRGKVGDKLTIYGDWLYDWAKLYQSLLGYDKILLEKEINENYENKMKKTFENYFLELYSTEDLNNLKLITKSLLFTLIPLHNNEKCIKYFNLI